jgi:hypothetical protein
MHYRLSYVTLLCFLVAVSCGAVAADLSADVTLDQNGFSFEYTVLNAEPIGSNYYLCFFNLQVNAPLVSIDSPDGWGYESDYATYVTWFSEDEELPYPHDVAPGRALNGFLITSAVMETDLLSYSVASWDHLADEGGLLAQDVIIAPSGSVVPDPTVPEPMSIMLGIIGLGSVAGFKRLRRK